MAKKVPAKSVASTSLKALQKGRTRERTQYIEAIDSNQQDFKHKYVPNMFRLL